MRPELTLIPDQPYPCPAKGCLLSFADGAELYTHKRSDGHHFCAKCDVMCDDWDGYLDHLVRSTNEPGDERRHHACEHCGRDHKTDEGLERHIQSNHRTTQPVQCKGCDKTFASASRMIGHIEKGWCRNPRNRDQAISSIEFRDHITQKNIINKALNQGSGVVRHDWLSETADSDVFEEDTGGVSISRRSEAGGTITHSRTLSLTRDPQDWPKPADTTNLPRRIAKVPTKASYSAALPAINELADTKQDPSQRMIDLWKGKQAPLTAEKLATKKDARQFGRTPMSLVSYSDSGDSSRLSSPAPVDTAAIEKEVNEKMNAISLIDDTRSDVPPRSTGLASGAHSAHSIASNQGNDFNTRFWDPTSDHWAPERFFNPVTLGFECPHPTCSYIDSNQPAFKKHCFSKHAPSTYRCPSCLKEYRDLQSLVAHCETTSRKCRIQRSDAFAWFIHNVTGGYLDASKRNKKGEVLYEASLPSDFQDVRKAKDVKKFW